MLSLCATPIGNMEDITLRVLRTLRESDLIYCEDTRHSMLLLNHYEIRKPLVSCHMHNERERAEELVTLLREGKHVSYISDAGMPGISDPGAVLIETCIREELPFEILPGASAALMSIVFSGMDTGHFTFYGFLPRSGKERKTAIETAAEEKWPVIFYESPHRVEATLKDLFEGMGDVKACVLRELTKKFECAKRGTLTELIAFYAEDPKGECVIIADPSTAPERNKKDEQTPEGIMEPILSAGGACKEAAAVAAAALGMSKKEAYAIAVKLKQNI